MRGDLLLFWKDVSYVIWPRPSGITAASKDKRDLRAIVPCRGSDAGILLVG